MSAATQEIDPKMIANIILLLHIQPIRVRFWRMKLSIGEFPAMYKTTALRKKCRIFVHIRQEYRFYLKGGALLYAHEQFKACPTLDIDVLGTALLMTKR